MTLNAYPPDEDLEKHCLKKLEAASADVVEDEVQTPLLICLKDIVQLLENGDPAKCMFLGEVKTLGPHYKVNLTVDPVLLGAHERTTRLVLASPTSNLEAHDPLGPCMHACWAGHLELCIVTCVMFGTHGFRLFAGKPVTILGEVSLSQRTPQGPSRDGSRLIRPHH